MSLLMVPLLLIVAAFAMLWRLLLWILNGMK